MSDELKPRKYARNKDRKQLRRIVDGGEQLVEDPQIKVRRSVARNVPEWTLDPQRTLAVLKLAFPLIETNEKQRRRAGRWLRIIHLYYKMKTPFGQVAEELGLSRDQLRSYLRSISRTVKGKRADGSGDRMPNSIPPPKGTGSQVNERDRIESPQVFRTEIDSVEQSEGVDSEEG